MALSGNGFTTIIIGGVLALVTGISGFTVAREYIRNDDQGQRIMELELAKERDKVVDRYVLKDLDELKKGVKAIKAKMGIP